MDEPQQDPSLDAKCENLRLLRAYIAANGVACPVCGYNLRGLTADCVLSAGSSFSCGSVVTLFGSGCS